MHLQRPEIPYTYRRQFFHCLTRWTKCSGAADPHVMRACSSCGQQRVHLRFRIGKFVVSMAVVMASSPSASLLFRTFFAGNGSILALTVLNGVLLVASLIYLAKD
ncbi:hypothetical protein QBC47DRAFT_388566 [Echria macrotheca]|uniref:Uncharacterized protein n=1 Tax=Echria macrotheca TaxID=438768 RepID=A0AAJ0B959_9PEZI|nr:hypothetical protein QBC47DRAFT_388566 [Echria macrotheca]